MLFIYFSAPPLFGAKSFEISLWCNKSSPNRQTSYWDVKQDWMFRFVNFCQAVSRNTGNYWITNQTYTEQYWKVLSRSTGNYWYFDQRDKKIFLIQYWKAVSRNTGNYSITNQTYTEQYWKVLSRSTGNYWNIDQRDKKILSDSILEGCIKKHRKLFNY